MGYADVGIGKQRLGGLGVVVNEFRRAPDSIRGSPRAGGLPTSALTGFAKIKMFNASP